MVRRRTIRDYAQPESDILGSQNRCNTCYGVVAMGQCYGQLDLDERIEIIACVQPVNRCE